MAAEREPSAEKQLLDLIEQPKPKGVQQAAIKRQGLSLLSLGAFKGRFSFFQKKTKDALALKSGPVDIHRVNRILQTAVFGLTIYFVSSFIIALLDLKKAPAVASKTKVSAAGKIAKIPAPLKKLSFYREKVRSRDIFNPPSGTIETDASGRQEFKPTPEIVKLTEDLKLVGIAWSTDPDVMIEDTEKRKVYFLKKGELLGNIKIQAIFKDSVVLSYEGEEVTLR